MTTFLRWSKLVLQLLGGILMKTTMNFSVHSQQKSNTPEKKKHKKIAVSQSSQPLFSLIYGLHASCALPEEKKSGALHVSCYYGPACSTRIVQ